MITRVSKFSKPYTKMYSLDLILPTLEVHVLQQAKILTKHRDGETPDDADVQRLIEIPLSNF